MKSFLKIYTEQKSQVDKKLSVILKKREPKSLYGPADYIIQSPGKRLRPILVLFSAKAVGLNFKDAYNAALSAELLHDFTLVHDDIMDNADTRRNRLTVHKKWDTNTAILVGDVLLAVAYELLTKDIKKNEKEIVSAFTKGLVEVCEGQSLDKDYELRKDVSLSEYIFMIQKKTAAMSEMCCKIGALLGDGKKEEVKALSNYGKYLGIAFQIQDDLLDIVGDENEFGKKIGGDLIEGKKTFLFINALEKSKGISKKKLLEVIKNKGIKEHELEFYKKIYTDLGVLESAKNEIEHYTNKALLGLKILKRKEDREFFTWLAYSLIKRTN